MVNAWSAQPPPDATFPDPHSTGLGSVHTQPVLSPLCPSPLPSFHPSPLSQFSVSQQDRLHRKYEKALVRYWAYSELRMQGGCLQVLSLGACSEVDSIAQTFPGELSSGNS